eukprot:TRINITY_DN13655_c0_g3_i3.p2 TRINITY_DN13655_c0_g3~~TRINITY_DN13655_c0_g3_i3.p2  ORF type:complete len:314 (+),score=-22.04 TRINITY_DN13655_c0_g3_i3:551-1492(+)
MMHLGCACGASVPALLFLSKHSKRQMPFDPARLSKVSVLSRPVRINHLYKHLIESLAPHALVSLPAPRSPRLSPPPSYDEDHLSSNPAAASSYSPSPAPSALTAAPTPYVPHGSAPLPVPPASGSAPATISTPGPTAPLTKEQAQAVVARDVAALRVAVVKDPTPLGRTDRSSPRPGDLQVLIAEDNIVNQRVLLKLLNGIGVRSCYTAVNGLEVMQRLRQVKVDLVLMDVQMPEMDGLTATACLRRELPPEQQPVVAALTADVGSGIESECRDAGMNSYLSKPVSKPHLHQLITRCLAWRQKGPIDPHAWME